MSIDKNHRALVTIIEKAAIVLGVTNAYGVLSPMIPPGGMEFTVEVFFSLCAVDFLGFTVLFCLRPAELGEYVFVRHAIVGYSLPVAWQSGFFLLREIFRSHGAGEGICYAIGNFASERLIPHLSALAGGIAIITLIAFSAGFVAKEIKKLRMS